MAEPFDLRLRVGREELHLAGELDGTPVRLVDVLPLFHGLADAFMGVATREAQALERTVSCGPGCGACCRQLVPVAPAEAQALAEHVAGLPEERREALRARFARTVERLEASGLRERLEVPPADPEARRTLGLDYFALGLPCPFLEAESCSIHPLRPAACREYLVSSAPAWCAAPEQHPVEMLAPPRRVSQVLYRLSEDRELGTRWLALPLALAQPPMEWPLRPAGDHLQRFLAALARA